METGGDLERVTDTTQTLSFFKFNIKNIAICEFRTNAFHPRPQPLTTARANCLLNRTDLATSKLQADSNRNSKKQMGQSDSAKIEIDNQLNRPP